MSRSASGRSSAREDQRNPLLRVISPSMLAILSSGVFLLSWAFPPALFLDYADEGNLVFLDLTSLLFVGACVACFLIGLGVLGKSRQASPIRETESSWLFSGVGLLLPLVIGTVFCAASSLLLIRDFPGLIIAAFSGSGDLVKDADIGLQAPLGLANTWLIGIVWWTMWRSRQMELTGALRWVVLASISLAWVSCVLNAALKMSRGELMPIVFGTAVVYLLGKATRNRPGRRFLVWYGVGVVSSVLFLYLLFAAARGQTSDRFISEVVGAMLSPYNHLCALLHHQLRLPYGGSGVYVLNFLVFNNALNHVVPLRHLLGIPDFTDVWLSEFDATWAAGLDGYRIFDTAFGYIYADLGWLTPGLFFVYGVLYGRVWRAVRKGTALGICLYPWFAFCVVFWFGTNYLLDNKITVLFLDAALLTIYERIAGKRGERECEHLVLA